MSNRIEFYVEDVDARLASFDSIELYRDTSPDGAFATLVTTIALVEGQEEYDYTDPDGTASSWYRHRFYDTPDLEGSEYSPAYQVGGSTLLRARLSVAVECGAAFASEAASESSQTLLRDAALRDQGVDVSFLEGAWIDRPAAADAGDRVRRVKVDGFDPSSGDLAPLREWANAPASELYHVYALLPPRDQPGVPYSWDRAVRDGLSMCWFLDRLNLGEGSANVQTRYEDFSLAAHLSYVSRDQLREVLVQDGVGREYDWSKQGRAWDVVEDGAGSLSVRLKPPPGTGRTVIVEVQRQPDPVYADDDLIRGVSEEVLRYAGAYQAFSYLNRQPATRGQYEVEAAGALREWRRRYRKPSARLVMGG